MASVGYMILSLILNYLNIFRYYSYLSSNVKKKCDVYASHQKKKFNPVQNCTWKIMFNKCVWNEYVINMIILNN